MNPIYMDHAASTPLDPRVRAAMDSYWDVVFSNPSSIHRSGQKARMAVDQARESIASSINADPTEIIFTSGGTESDNAAIRGVAFANQSRGRHIVTTSIEHEAVIETCRDLQEQFGLEVTYVAPAPDGIVRAEEIDRAIGPETTLVSVMYANNEVGTVQPLRDIAEICHRRGVTLHTDAVQAAGSIPIDVEEIGVDLLSMSAHKFYGPKGVGVLYVRKGVRWHAQQLGGGQERRRRSGTENVPAIVGMAAALQIATSNMGAFSSHVSGLRDDLLALLRRNIPDAHVNGSLESRLPANANVSFPGLDGESLVLALDAAGIQVSSGSACSSGSIEPSHVLEAMGLSRDLAAGALRLSLGRENTSDEVRVVATEIVDAYRRLSGAGYNGAVESGNRRGTSSALDAPTTAAAVHPSVRAGT
jgi:cysteine desulfurase